MYWSEKDAAKEGDVPHQTLVTWRDAVVHPVYEGCHPRYSPLCIAVIKGARLLRHMGLPLTAVQSWADVMYAHGEDGLSASIAAGQQYSVIMIGPVSPGGKASPTFGSAKLLPTIVAMANNAKTAAGIATVTLDIAPIWAEVQDAVRRAEERRQPRAKCRAAKSHLN